MGTASTSISLEEFSARVGTAGHPLVFDVRREQAFIDSPVIVPTARWRDHRLADTWGQGLPAGREVAVYCVHGHQVSQSAAALLRGLGVPARYLEGGIEAYRHAGGPTVDRSAIPGGPAGRPSRWVTRERPKIDRIACPWFIRRFIDSQAEFYYVAPEWVKDAATELAAVPYDIPDVVFSHQEDRCTFDAFLQAFGVKHEALARLAAIVRGADTGRLDLMPQSAGLLAFSIGLSAVCKDDNEMLERGMNLYDYLYGWCRQAAEEAA